MKKKILLPILLLATMSLGGALVACDPGSNQPTSSTQSQYKVAIDNKAALEGEWYEGDAKDLELTLTPEANALQELQNKNLTVTSSDETVVKVTGLGLTALKEGTAKITVDYRGAKEEVNVTILSKSAKKKYGVAHEGTAEDPFTNEDALAVAKSEKYGGEVYYVKGTIDRFYYAPGTNEKNGVAYYLKAATEGGEQFEIFKCFKADGSQLTDDDIWVGGEATAYGAFTKYNSQYETSSAVFVSCTGTKPQARQTLTKTFAEVLAVGNALKDSDSTWDYYKFQGYVTVKSGTDFYLTATKGEALVPGKSDAAHGERDIKGTNAIELYGAGKVEALAAKLLEGAKVEVTMNVKNYHGTIENSGDLKDENVTVLEAGTPWAVPEPAVANKTVTEFIALENNKKNAYIVKATIKAFKSGDTKDEYGNMTITDGTSDVAIYGASATATALAWDGAGEYAFTNPKDFLTNETTSALKVGDEITMKLIRADYIKDGVTKAIQGTGIITAVTAPDTPTLESFTLDYSGLTNDKNSEITTDALEKLGQGNAHVTAVTASKIYCNTGSGGAFPTANGMVKGGTGSANGSIAFTLDVDVVKVEVKCHDFYKKDADHPTNSNSVQVNDLAAQLAPYTEDGTFGTLEFELAAGSKSITIETQKRVYIKEITFYYAASGDTPAADLKVWSSADVKAALSDQSLTEKDFGDGVKGYKFKKTGGVSCTLTYSAAEAKATKLYLQISVKIANNESAGFWRQTAGSDSDKADPKTKITINGTEVTAPAEDINFKNAGLTENSTQSDNGTLSLPVYVEITGVNLQQGDNTIKVEYVAGGYAYYLCGAKLA